MPMTLEELEKRIEQIREALQHKLGDAVLGHHIEPMRRELAELDKKIDAVIDATIKAVTTQSVEGLKALKRR
jgi:hypothetical protein